MITIVLVDDHQIVRQGLTALLSAESDFEVLGDAADGLQALALVKQLRPNILVVDLNMPGLNGVVVVRAASTDYPETKIIVLSMDSSDYHVLSAFAGGG